MDHQKRTCTRLVLMVTIILGLATPTICIAQTGSITGTVTSDVSSLPLEGMWVSVFVYQTENWVNGGLTDAAGVYTIANLDNGSYRVEVEGAIVNGLHYAGEYYNDTYILSQAAEVVVSGGGPTAGINFSLAPGGTITGTVTSDPEGGGTPLEGLIVDATYPGSGEWAGGKQTDASGFYSITTLPGSYILDVHNGTTYRPEYYDNVYDPDDATQVTVTEGQTTSGIDFSLARKTGAISLIPLILDE